MELVRLKKTKVIVSMIAFFAIWSILWKITVLDIERDMFLSLDTGEYHELETLEMTKSDKLQQFFKGNETVYAIDLYVNKETAENVEIHVCVNNITDGITIFNENVKVENEKTRIIVKDNKYSDIFKDYAVAVQPITQNISISLTKDDLYKDGSFIINEKEEEHDMVMKVFSEGQKQSKYWMVYLGCVGMILIAVYFIWSKKWSIEQKCGLLIFVIGIIYAVQFPPQTIHDEDIHIDVAYRLSNMIMSNGYENADGSLLMREGDLRIYQLTGRNSLRSHQYVMENFQLFNYDNTTVDIQAETLTKNVFLYLPQVLGMILARILNLGCFPLFYLSKMLGVLFFSICLYYAIKITPIGKMAFAVIALLPMTVQQTIGITYDSSLNGIALLLTAVCLKLIYDTKINKKYWILMGILALWLLMFKRGVYVFILLLLLLIIEKKKVHFNKKYMYVTVASSIVVGFSILYINRGVIVDLLGGEGTVNYSYSYIIQHPLSFLSLLWQTIIVKGSTYVETMIGIRLAWDEIAVNSIVIVSFGILLLISVMHTEGEQVIILKRDKIVFCIVTFLVFCAVEVAALGWTSVDSPYIWGVQGRYFIPILPIMLLTLDNQVIFFKKDQSNNILILGGLLHIFVLFDVNRFILGC